MRRIGESGGETAVRFTNTVAGVQYDEPQIATYGEVVPVGGDLEVSPDTASEGEPVEINPSRGSSTVTDDLGLFFTPTTTLGGISFDVSGSAYSPGSLFLRESGSNDILFDVNLAAGSGYTVNQTLFEGRQYELYITNSGEGAQYDPDPQLPKSTPGLTVDSGYRNGSTDPEIGWFTNVTPLVRAESGVGYVEVESPGDLVEWSAINFQRDEDGGSAVIDIEENQDGSAGNWVSIQSDAGRNTPIESDAEKLRYVVTITGNTPSQTPRVPAVFAQYIR